LGKKEGKEAREKKKQKKLGHGQGSEDLKLCFYKKTRCGRGGGRWLYPWTTFHPNKKSQSLNGEREENGDRK